MQKTKILIVDDHHLIREGLKKILQAEQEFEVIGEFSEAGPALLFITHNDVDLLILDINLPDKSGIDVLNEIKEMKTDLKILILSAYPEEQYAERVFRAGAMGYVTKDSASDELLAAVKKIIGGGRYVSSKLADMIATRFDFDLNKKLHEKLSEREFQIMIFIAKGISQAEIAIQLSLSPTTINTYRTRILDKLKLNSNAEMIHYAIRNNLVQ
jgi:DNA-binding NarL/FixJ family response regulator